MHRLGQMRRLRMLEEQKAWKREADFDYIDTAAEMDARRSRTNLVSEPFFQSKMSNPRWPHVHDEFTLKMRVDVEGRRMEIVLSRLSHHRNAMHPRDVYPRSIRGWRNPERRDGCSNRYRAR